MLSKQKPIPIGVHILGTITIAKKAECWPLMMADFQAHASSISEARMKSGLTGYFDMNSWYIAEAWRSGLNTNSVYARVFARPKNSAGSKQSKIVLQNGERRDARRDTASQ